MDSTDESTDVRSKVLRNTLQEISSRTINNSTSSVEVATECCVICLDEISEIGEANPCGHRNFDYLCLLTWLERQSSCPLCKAKIKEVRYDFHDAEKQWKTHPVSEKKQQGKEVAVGNQNGLPHRQYAINREFTSRRRHRFHQEDPVRPPSFEEAILRRRHIYRNQLYSLHVGSNRVSRYKELTPQLFSSDEELISRARMWIRRELQVFEFLSMDTESSSSHADPVRRRRANNAEFLLEYIIAILKTVDIQGSCGQAEDMLQEFLGRDNTRLFLHELRAFLRSPYATLENWDRAVQYHEQKSRDLQEVSRGRASGSRNPPRSVTSNPATWRRLGGRTPASQSSYLPSPYQRHSERRERRESSWRGNSD
jgi:hypothetical protein